MVQEKSKNAQKYPETVQKCAYVIYGCPLSNHCRWYVDLWDEFSKCKSGDKKDEQETDEGMDIADDNNSNDGERDFNTRDFNYTDGQFLNHLNY